MGNSLEGAYTLHDHNRGAQVDLKLNQEQTSTHSNDPEYLWHVVPCVLLDDGDDLTKLFEQVLPHVLVTGTHHTQEWRHHLLGCGV